MLTAPWRCGRALRREGYWRREWDSNPRYGFCPYNALAGRLFRPLGHLSKSGANIAQRLAPSACATVAATMDPLDLGRSRNGEPATELKALRQLADQAFARAAGAPLVAGNGVRILRDAVGRDFVELLAERARAGVRVRLIYDWLGTRTSRSFLRPLVDAGGEFRVF